MLSGTGRNQHASDLADAFHNLPVFMFSQDFSWAILWNFVDEYEDLHGSTKGMSPFDYRTQLEKVQAGAQDIE
jgi:hypothetical protein